MLASTAFIVSRQNDEIGEMLLGGRVKLDCPCEGGEGEIRWISSTGKYEICDHTNSSFFEIASKINRFHSLACDLHWA